MKELCSCWSKSLGREAVSLMARSCVVPVKSSWERRVLLARVLVLASPGQRGSSSRACTRDVNDLERRVLGGHLVSLPPAHGSVRTAVEMQARSVVTSLLVL